MNEATARKFLGCWMRQCSGGTPRAEVPMTPELEKLVDQPTAQKIWTELRDKVLSVRMKNNH